MYGPLKVPVLAEPYGLSGLKAIFLPEIIVLWLIVAKLSNLVSSSDRVVIEIASDMRIRPKPSQYCISFSRF